VVDTEAVVAAAPDVVLLTHANRTLGDLRARPGWAAVPAVREGRVYALDPDAISRPGPRIADALEEAERRLAGARAGLAGARAEASGGDAGAS
jgi:iron complex transport system substrate-binding protein